MNFKNSNPFQYKVIGVGVNFSLQDADGEEIAASRELEDIAQAIIDDSEIMLAYEEGRVDFSNVETCEEEIRELVTSLNFSENFEESEDY